MIENLGNIGDFIGGFGVVVTVIYLAFQVRQNTASTRSASYQSVVAAVAEWTLQLGLNPDATRIFGAGIEDLESLSKEEKVQFNFILASVIRHFENIHFQFISGAIENDVWDGWSSRILGIMGNPGAETWWASQKTAFSREFQHFVDGSSGESHKTNHYFRGLASNKNSD